MIELNSVPPIPNIRIRDCHNACAVVDMSSPDTDLYNFLVAKLASGQEAASATGAIAIRNKLLETTYIPNVLCDTIACFAMPETYWSWTRTPGLDDIKKYPETKDSRERGLRFLLTRMTSYSFVDHYVFDLTTSRALYAQPWISTDDIRVMVEDYRDADWFSPLNPYSVGYVQLLDEMAEVGAVAKKFE